MQFDHLAASISRATGPSGSAVLRMLPAVTRRARALLRCGDRDDDARRLLAHALADIDPITASADRRLIQAALTYADALSGHGFSPLR